MHHRVEERRCCVVVKMKKLSCMMLVAVMLLCTGCGKSSANETQSSPGPSATATHPALSLADFDQIESGMLLSEAVEILGYRGRYIDPMFPFYEYTTIENITVRLACCEVDSNVPMYDSNMKILAIEKYNPDGSVYTEE